MGSFIRFAAFAALIALPVAGRADTFTFSYSGGSSTFSLPATPTNASKMGNSTDGYYFSVPVTDLSTNGGTASSATVFFNDTGSFAYWVNGSNLVFAQGNATNKMYSGSESSPTFLVGTYALTLNNQAATLSIAAPRANADPLAASTPEPSSLLLLGSGLLGTVGVVRRRYAR